MKINYFRFDGHAPKDTSLTQAIKPVFKSLCRENNPHLFVN